MAAPTDEITTGEVSRRLDDLSKSIDTGFKDLGEKVERRPVWEDVRRIEKALVTRIEKMESWSTWLGRLLLGGVLLALLGLVVKT